MSQSTKSGSFRWSQGEIIGCGGFGVVYSGSFVDYNGLHRQIAVKTASVEEASSLRRETRILNAFRGCPEILTCYTAGESVNINGRKVYNLILEYAPCGTLDDLIAKSNNSSLPEDEVRAYTRMILKGLDCIHLKGFVHCDIKPENILVFPSTGTDYKYELKIGDFGMAVGPEEWFMRGGTPKYMSPESLVKNEAWPGVDVWSLGCTVVEMITGKNPWDGKFQKSAEMEDFIDLLRDNSPEIPQEMSECGKDFLEKCFVRDSGLRWSARELLSHPFVLERTHQEPPRAVFPLVLPHELLSQQRTHQDPPRAVFPLVLPHELLSQQRTHQDPPRAVFPLVLPHELLSHPFVSERTHQEPPRAVFPILLPHELFRHV